MMLCEKCAKDNAHAGFVEVNIADLQHFLIDTERYAIGRRSYYPPMAMGTIRKSLLHCHGLCSSRRKKG